MHRHTVYAPNFYPNCSLLSSHIVAEWFGLPSYDAVERLVANVSSHFDLVQHSWETAAMQLLWDVGYFRRKGNQSERKLSELNESETSRFTYEIKL